MMNSHRHLLQAGVLSGLLTLVAVFVGGCSSTSSSSSRSTSTSLDAAMADYDAQRYSAARSKASAAMASSTGPQRERAAYIAGLCAYQTGDFSHAEKDLGAAAVSSDPQIAGNAKVMLGQLCLDQHRPRQAASYFADASRQLQGEDARQAAWHAGLAYRQAGDEVSAKRWLDTASGAQFDRPGNAVASASGDSTTPRGSSTLGSASPPSSSGSSRSSASAARSGASTAGSSTGGGSGQTTLGFTLQIGAFGDKDRARRAAEDAEILARQEKLGRVRIIPRRDSRGQPMYLVQVGWWVTRSEADSARTRLGRLEYIVAPAPV